MAQELATDEQGRLIIDVRGPRFSATITSLVLGAALVIQGSAGIALVAWQWVAFGIAAIGGLRWSLYGRLFRWVKRRFELGPPPATEPEAAPRFAQLCGFAVASFALALFALGLATAGWIAVGVVLALSVLLASTGICVGCELYVVGRKILARGH